MTETPAEPQPYPWLPIDDVAAWVGVDTEGDPQVATSLETVRRAAAAHCERQRPDLRVDLYDPEGEPAGYTWTVDDDRKLAGLIAAARLWSRRGTPAGLASFGEFGASEILRLDPDVSRLLGTGRHATPRVG